ncbi:MAG: TrmH family RNA methyltransferase [Patescibacteria group bacterium]
MSTVVVLDNIRSVHNVGSLFRTCEGAGVSKLYLCGVTPAPKDRFGRIRPDLAKVALGTENLVPWEEVKGTATCISKLKEEGFTIVAVEQDERSKDFKMFTAKEKTAFVFGEETKGLSKELVDMCDEILEIPMQGEKESLNVSVAAGIVLFWG